ncbi:hypothetical protein MIC448_510011 [Microbacterium sp. C448]|nr:hypothetical protein MIC448_510011 [Microbacterium sp. C448]
MWARCPEKAPRETVTRGNATTPPRAERVAVMRVRVQFINMVTSFQTSDARSDASADPVAASSRFTEIVDARALPDGRHAPPRVA